MLDMFLYVPVDVDTKSEGFQFPNAKVDIPRLIQAINSKPTKSEEEREDDDNDNNRYRRREGPDNSKEITAEHSEPLWSPILAWSFGMSANPSNASGRGRRRRNDGNISMTKYSDFKSAPFLCLMANGTNVPQVYLRVIGEPKEQKLFVQEFEMVNARITSLSTGGSGGEDRFTENIQIQFDQLVHSKYEFSMETSEILGFSQLFWDRKEQKVNRGGTGVKADTSESSESSESAKPVESGIKRSFQVAWMGSKVFKQILIFPCTLDSLKKEAEVSFGKSIKNVYTVNEDWTISLDSDEEVRGLAPDILIYVD